MSEENKIGTYQFVAEPFHVDFNGRLTMGVLGNHLLNCAGFHASDRGFGIATLNEDNYTWVLFPSGDRAGRDALPIREVLGSDMGGECLSSLYRP